MKKYKYIILSLFLLFTFQTYTYGQIGNTMNTAIDIGNQSGPFSYVDTKNTNGYTNNNNMMCSGNDVFYRFTITKTMEMVISHCGSETLDTFLQVLDSSGNLIMVGLYDNALETCGDTPHPYIFLILEPGTYYVVSEGCSGNGNITTHIEGNIKLSLRASYNYIHTITPREACSAESDLKGYNTMNIIQYFDGLGQPSQTVQLRANPDKDDLVTYQTYDDYGREAMKWLPSVASDNNGAFMRYDDFRNKAYHTYVGEQKPYSHTYYENSPLSRVTQEFGPGHDWHYYGRSVKTEYLSNNRSYPCRLYKFTGTNSTIKFYCAGNYTEKQLYVTRTMDEDDKNNTFEFKDKLGQLILSRQMNEGKPHDTYYIYDDFGNLRVVIPPMLADILTAYNINWTDTTDVVKYAYQYKYDGRNRCIGKKLPGTAWITYVYDKTDRLVFSQDGEQKKAGIWKFSLPDPLRREVVTGTFKTLKVGSTTTTITPGCLDNVVLTAVFGKATSPLKGYTTPGVTLGTPVALTVNYYDNYDFMGVNSIPAATNAHIKYDTDHGADFNTRYTVGHKGLLTGKLTVSLENTSKVLYSVMYYDYRGRVIQTKSNNHMNNFTAGYEKEYIAYNFSDQPIKKKHIHIASGKATQTEEYAYTYDHAGRLTQTTHKLNSGAAVVLASNTYDKIGRLEGSKKGNLPKTEYTYNIRSWIKRIYTADLFDEELFYNEKQVENNPQYNGNITAMTWRIRAPHLAGLRGYTFMYDDLSQLKTAKYQYNNNPDYWDYHTVLSYDKNGNMTRAYRLGKGDNWGLVDNAVMTYDGNQLVRLEDNGPDSKSPESGDIKDYEDKPIEYTYNKNGAMTSDLNKGVTNITYNLLNLPKQLDINNPLGRGRNIYKYTADGTKLQVKQLTGTSLNVADSTDYVGNKVYENGSLKRILVDGGYIENGTYYYYLTDHLGSVRLTVKSDGSIAQEVDYYPFGMVCGQLSEAHQSFQPYKYNGKELDRMAGLNIYDYGARYMDPAIGRFTTIDPLAEKYYNISPYAYCLNNPVKFIDPDGESPYYDMFGRFLGVDAGGFSGQILIADKAVYDYNIAKGITSSKTSHIQDLDLSARALSSIYTHIIKEAGFDTNMLHNNAIAVKGIYDSYNKPTTGKEDFLSTAFTLKEGSKFKISMTDGESSRRLLNTVENAISALGDHEYTSHGMNKKRDDAKNHHEAYGYQMDQPIFQKTTNAFQNYIYKNFDMYFKLEYK